LIRDHVVFDRLVPERDMPVSRGDLLSLGAVLLVGFFGLVPLFDVVLGVPPFLTVPVVGLIYATVAVRRRELLASVVIGVIVTSTFAANVPLVSTAALVAMPGSIGPDIWLVYPVLLVAYSFVVGLDRGRLSDSWGLESTLFLGFVFWVAVGAVAASPPRPDVVLYYALYLCSGLLTYQLIKYAVRTGMLGVRAVIGTLFATVCGHLLYGLLQFLNQGTFAVTELGEPGSTRVLAELQLAVLGVYDLGTFVTGFAGFTFNVAALGVLVVGLPFAYYHSGSGWSRSAIVVPPLAAFVVRVTTSDSARGAFVIALVATLLSLRVATKAEWTVGSLDTVREKAYYFASAVLAVVLVLLPSSTSGSPSRRVSSGDSAGGSAGVPLQRGPVADLLGSLSVPGFDLSNLSIRLQQYVLGLDLFAANPIVGIGAGNFRYYGAAVDPTLELELHNLYLSVLVETGLVGFALYFGAIGLVLSRGLMAIPKSPPSTETTVLVAVFAGLLGQLAMGGWDILQLTKVTVFLPFWIALGAIAARSERVEWPDWSIGIEHWQDRLNRSPDEAPDE
jgi:O-antigen ligase